MEVTLDEIWALAKEHARDNEQMLPTIDPDSEYARNVRIEGLKAKFHIDNDPGIYYTLGDIDDLVYVDTEAAREKDSITGPYLNKKEFKQRINDIAEEQRERRSH